MTPESPKPKRHYVPVLPQPTEQQFRNVKKASAKRKRDNALSRKLDELLGSVEEE